MGVGVPAARAAAPGALAGALVVPFAAAAAGVVRAFAPAGPGAPSGTVAGGGGGAGTAGATAGAAIRAEVAAAAKGLFGAPSGPFGGPPPRGAAAVDVGAAVGHFFEGRTRPSAPEKCGKEGGRRPVLRGVCRG